MRKNNKVKQPLRPSLSLEGDRGPFRQRRECRRRRLEDVDDFFEEREVDDEDEVIDFRRRDAVEERLRLRCLECRLRECRWRLDDRVRE